MKSLTRLACLTLILSGGLSAQLLNLGGSTLKLAPAKNKASVDVIVQYDRAPDQTLLGRILTLGGSLIQQLPLIDAVAVTIPIDELDSLAKQPNVLHVSRDFEMTAAMTNVNAATGANVAHKYGWDGSGVGIALIDSGIDRHSDLPLRVVYSKDFVRPLDFGTDRHGHGTHIAGILFGQGQKQKTSTWGRRSEAEGGGVAPGAHLVNLRVLDEHGSGKESDVIAAISEAISLKRRYNIRVINLSLGRPVFESWKTDPLCIAVKKAWDEGIVVVVAAGNYGRLNEVGNNGYGTITSPGNAPSVITVGAMNTVNTPERGDDVMATYSSKGPSILDHVVKPDLVAPGNRVLSTIGDGKLPDQHPELVDSNGRTLLGIVTGQSDYMQLSGTSMAAPVVAGAVALMLQQDPGLSPDTVKARLMRSATTNFPNVTHVYDPSTRESFVIQNDIFTIGAGYLDIAGALQDNTIVRRGETAESPSVDFDQTSGEFYLAGGQTAIWGRNDAFGETVIWGRNVIEGSTVIWGRGGLWGSTAIWGRSGTEGFTVIWGRSSFDGSTVIWGRDSADGSTAIWGRDSAEGSTVIWGRSGSQQANALSSIMLYGE